ncbi:26S proteasome regulatory subunit RPN13 [Candida viswanathii]|uniref:26S proteasome regulatory subunit RPN13 n=1 Tax=Candida viswanathii TaxID=5486 RepID=A0A367XSI3_9ASCO|nr:26S proteasome regulatory subunit RPN13 [Candida viswanathii]
MASSKTLKFHAGKIQYDEETNRCTPLQHKGVVSIKPSADEPDFLSFTWTPKQDLTQGTAGVIEKDDFLLVPGDVTLKHIKSCNTGRVIALTFLSSGAKYLYWLQDVGDIDQLDKLTEKDEKIIQDINDLISINEEEDEEEIEPDVAKKEEVKVEPKFKMPIGSISSVLDIETINAHLDKLSIDQLKELYGEYLPQSIAANPTKEEAMRAIRSGFFQQCEHKLSELLRSNTGAGYLMSQSLKYEYKGEGVDGFLNGIRELARKEQGGDKDDDKKN